MSDEERMARALWLTHHDVDLKRRLIHIRQKTVGEQSWWPKTRRNRTVPIASALLPILEERQQALHRGVPWFFPSPDGKRWDPDNLSHRLAGLNAAAGLEWTCLEFRHTFGSQLAQRGVSLYKISTMMGNSPEICRRHYAALLPEQMHDDVEYHSGTASVGPLGQATERATDAGVPFMRIAR